MCELCHMSRVTGLFWSIDAACHMSRVTGLFWSIDPTIRRMSYVTSHGIIMVNWFTVRRNDIVFIQMTLT